MTSSGNAEVHLGYEVGTGLPVSIPIRNMVVCGQTQEAGKTTTLEALVERASGTPKYPYSAIAFITKRGETAFRERATEHQPYMEERADWQFVESLLEATMRQGMKFERSWIIQASRGAKKLADVHRNVKNLLTKAGGLSFGVFTTLDAYLDIVVPRLTTVKWADELSLAPGMNIFDLEDSHRFPMEIQALVIRSVLQWMYNHGNYTLSILPEAWEFLPQNRKSPVKLAAMELVRKGSNLHNHIWIDSQDIGGVDKEILRSCPVWLLGVQRETNEIKRTLDNIPAGMKKPTPAMIAHLEKGQFFACFGKTTVKVYVQPAWMSAEAAETSARYPEQASMLANAIRPVKARAPKPTAPKETPVVKPTSDDTRLDRLESLLEKFLTNGTAAQAATSQQIAPKLKRGPEVEAPPSVPELTGDGASQLEQIYDYVRERLMREAPGALLKLIQGRPEMVVTVKRREICLDESKTKGMVGVLIKEGFCDSPVTGNAVFKRMKECWGFSQASTRVYEACDDLVKDGFLRRNADKTYTSTGARVQVVEE